jgi:hypothetical protein
MKLFLVPPFINCDFYACLLAIRQASRATLPSWWHFAVKLAAGKLSDPTAMTILAGSTKHHWVHDHCVKFFCRYSIARVGYMTAQDAVFCNVNNSSARASRLWRQVTHYSILNANMIISKKKNTDHNIEEVWIDPSRGWVLQTLNHTWHIWRRNA